MRKTVLLLAATMCATLLAGSALILVVPAMPVRAALPGENGRIAFVSQRNGNEEIYVMNADGTDQTRLTNNASTGSTDATAGRDLLPSFLPYGKRVAFTSRRPVENIHDQGGIDEIYVMNAEDGDGVPEGDDLTRLTGDNPEMRHNFQSAFSADGKKMVFVGAWNGTNTNEIYVTDFVKASGTEPDHLGPVRRLTDTVLLERFPSFSPDGTKVAFSRRDGTDDIWVMNADGTRQTNLTNNVANDIYPSFSPDGTKIVFSSNRRASDGTADSEVYVMNADGSNPVPLTNNGMLDESPVFSPDGEKIAFTSTREGKTTNETANKEIWVMDADGSDPVRLTNNLVEDSKPDWGQLPDTTAPTTEVTLSEQPNASGWHQRDVTVSLAATDNEGGSGVEQIVYAVNGGEPVHVEGSSANVSVSQEGVNEIAFHAQDNAGVVEETRTITVRLDKTAPVLNVSEKPADQSVVELSDGIPAPSFAPTDEPPGTASGLAFQSDELMTPQTTSGVGDYAYTAKATDLAGNTSIEVRTFEVIYGSAFDGIRQPINSNGTSNFKLGSTIPVKFRLLRPDGTPIDNAVAHLWIHKAGTSSGAVNEAVSTANAGTGNEFRYDLTSGQYVFNLSTKAGHVYINPNGQPIHVEEGKWTLIIALDDGTNRTVDIDIRN